MLKITQIKSAIGYRPKAKSTLAALGLKKINQCVEKKVFINLLRYTSNVIKS